MVENNKSDTVEIIAFDGDEPSATALVWQFEEGDCMEDVRVQVRFSPDRSNMISEERLRKLATVAGEAVLKALQEE